LLSEKKILLVSMAASRLDDAIAFLLSQVDSASAQTAACAIEALSIYRHNERVSKSVRSAALGRREKAIIEAYQRGFGS
jgi:hypothetical protein